MVHLLKSVKIQSDFVLNLIVVVVVSQKFWSGNTHAEDLDRASLPPCGTMKLVSRQFILTASESSELRSA